MTPIIETDRLIMRGWLDSDREPYVALNADPVVMEHFPSTVGSQHTNEHVDRIIGQWETRGYSHWAVEVKGGAPFIGWVGLTEPGWLLSGERCVEIGWRLAKEHWGHGYAPEAARAALGFGFEVLGLDEIVAFTTTTNLKSQRVMQKIGMRHDPARDFDHPAIVEGSPLRRHVLYVRRRDDRSAVERVPVTSSEIGGGHSPGEPRTTNGRRDMTVET